MRLPVYDSVWRLERRIHAIGDVVLPFQPTALSVLVFLFTMSTWWLLLHTIGVPWSKGLLEIIYLGPPALVTYYSDKPVADGKTGPQWALSQVRYLCEPRQRDRPTRLVCHVRKGRT